MSRALEQTKEERIPSIKRYNMDHPHDHEGEDPIDMLRHKRIAEMAKRNRKINKE